MNKNSQYSDEFINAYIDNELDNEERACLLSDEQQDADLAQRINDARMLKEEVQLAYADFAEAGNEKKPFSCPAFISVSRSLVAGVVILLSAIAFFANSHMNNDALILAKEMISNTQPITPDALARTIGRHEQVVINISRYQAENFDTTIEHIETLLQQQRADQSFNIEIVASGNGLKALDVKTSLHAERISQLANKFDNLDVVACAKSMTSLAAAGNPIQLMRSIMITPSAAEQVAKRMSYGWMYLKI